MTMAEAIAYAIGTGGCHVNVKTGTMLAAILGSGIVFLDSTVVNVALQKIGEDLPSSYFGVLEGQSYVYNAYLLSLSALLILAGALADAYGRRRFFILGLGRFVISSILCGFAPTWKCWDHPADRPGRGRRTPGSGRAGAADAHVRGRGAGPRVRPVVSCPPRPSSLVRCVGGVLVETISWRAVFFLNVPLIAIALWAALSFVEESRDPDASRSFDWAGAAIVAVAVGGCASGLSTGSSTTGATRSGRSRSPSARPPRCFS